jgi:hypothetical protein
MNLPGRCRNYSGVAPYEIWREVPARFSEAVERGMIWGEKWFPGDL